LIEIAPPRQLNRSAAPYEESILHDKAMKKYLIIVETTKTGYSAFSPDVPGCGSTGTTKDEVERNIQEAIEFHLEGLREEGYEIPEPSTYSSYIDIAA
jgi:predicted RNase H-like HicB family nuclease